MALSKVANQDYEINKTSSPVTDLRTINILTALAVEKGWAIHHLDTSTAYLNAKILNSIPTYCQPPSEAKAIYNKVLESSPPCFSYTNRAAAKGSPTS